MSGIKRYSVLWQKEETEEKLGEYVKFSDHAAEIARLRAEVDANRVKAERRLELIRATLANSEWRHGARNIYAELSKELRASMGADA